MSELTQCNLCSKIYMEHKAKERGVELIVRLEPLSHEMGGWWSARYSDEDKPSAYWLAIPDRCVC